MLDRRTFLLTSLAAIASTLSGCSNSQNVLDITLLQGSIPPQLIGDFRKIMAKQGQIALNPEINLQAILELLTAWQKPEESSSFIDSVPVVGKNTTERANLVTLGDYWLHDAIADKLIQPLDTTELEGWDSLPTRWQNLVRRDRDGNLNPEGDIYGAPYRFGNTLIAYRQDKIAWTPTDWSDLWRKELKDRISLVDNYREVIGLTLKKLGYSYNTSDLSQVPNLETELQQLQQQVKLYSSDKYLQPLVLGDTWLAVGWSTDILELTKRYSDIGVVVPASGTSLWADVWVQPSQPQEASTDRVISSLLSTWINFCWNAKAVKQIALFTNSLSPILTGEDRQNIIQLEKTGILQSTIAAFDKSEFLYPQSLSTETAYLNLWKQIRQVSG